MFYLLMSLFYAVGMYVLIIGAYIAPQSTESLPMVKVTSPCLTLFICILAYFLKSTDTGTERRGYAYGDTGYGIFQKQPFGDTAGYINI